MRTYPVFRVCAVLTVIALSFFSFASIVEAKGRLATVGTTLTIEPPASVSVGNPSIIVIKLISSKGEPVADQPVELFVNGEQVRRTKTDASGDATVRVQQDVAGVYELSATFKGSKSPSLGSSKATAELIVSPALVEILVTPSLPDIKFSLDGKVFVSDDYGVARIEVEKAGKYHLEILPLEIKDEDIQMQFGRWSDDSFEPFRDIEVPLQKPLEVGFEVSYEVSQSFVDLSGDPVDPARITSITYKGSNGGTFTFEDTGAHWIPAGRVIRLNNGLEETKILYSVMSIVIDGANVVSQAQQRFYVHTRDQWTIQVLLYSANFTARDALFGFPIGTGIHMEYPDGDIQSYSFDPQHGYSIEGLARGIYKVTVTGAQGYAPPTPIALSRSQDVELMVFSYLDMGFLASIGLLLSVGLLLFGRPFILTQTLAFVGRLIPKRGSLQPARLHEKLIAVGTRLRRRKPITQPDEGNPEMGMSELLSGDLSESELADLSVDIPAGKAKNEVENLV